MRVEVENEVSWSAGRQNLHNLRTSWTLYSRFDFGVDWNPESRSRIKLQDGRIQCFENVHVSGFIISIMKLSLTMCVKKV